jgi:DNA replication protein DnaC
VKDDDLLSLILDKLGWLRLPGMARALARLAEQARTENLSPLQIVDRLADEEKGSRINSAVQRRIRDARFPEINTVDGFDFDFDADRKKSRGRYLALHDLTFPTKGSIRSSSAFPAPERRSSRALAYKACQSTKRVVFVSAPKMLNELHGAELHGRIDRVLAKYVRADLLVIDDFACLEMDATQAKLAFQVISERYDYRRSTSITTNRPFKDWPKVFPDALNAQVIAERLTERSEHFVFNGKGYRTKL